MDIQDPRTSEAGAVTTLTTAPSTKTISSTAPTTTAAITRVVVRAEVHLATTHMAGGLQAVAGTTAPTPTTIEVISTTQNLHSTTNNHHSNPAQRFISHITLTLEAMNLGPPEELHDILTSTTSITMPKIHPA